MSMPTEYLVPEKVITLIEEAKLSLSALRLFHSCYAYIDQMPELEAGILAMQHAPPCRAVMADVAALCGAPNAKSHVWVRDAITEFQRKTGPARLFSHVGLSGAGRVLEFKLANGFKVAAMRTKTTPFAMLNVNDVAVISSPHELLFYTRATMVDRMDYPKFLVPNVGGDGEAWSNTVKRRTLRIAARVGGRLEQDYVIEPLRHPVTREIQKVVVKAVTDRSIWMPGGLYRRRASAPVSIVHGGAFRTLTTEELRGRRDWTSVVGR